jgi:chromosomal replication initiation ATPase DnaA
LVQRLAEYEWSSYLAYAYGKNVFGWLQRDVIFSYFSAKDPRRAYRSYVQEYAEEESRLWEDFRHGLFLGSEEFAKRIKERFLSQCVHPEVPQQKLIQREDAKEVLEKGLGVLHCDVKDLLTVWRVQGGVKEDRDLLIYFLWSLGHYKNEEISRLFGLTYSAISHCVREIANKLECNSPLRKKLDQINSQFEM